MIKWFRRRRTTLGIIWIVFLFLVTFSYGMFQGGFVSWFVFYSFVPVMLYTLAIAIYPLNDLKVERQVEKDELFADEPLNVTVRIKRRWRFPLFYLIIEDHAPENMLKRHHDFKREDTKGLFSLGFQRETTFKFTIKGMPRGEYQFNTLTVKTGDIFGFIQKQRVINLEKSVLVYPKLNPPQKWTPLDLSYGGRHRSKKHFEHDLTSISSIRDYNPGDRLSWLDWKATARTNKLVTKQFEYPLNKDIVIVLDRTMNHADEEGERFERSVSLAASLSDRALRTGSSVGFVSIGKETMWVEMQDQAYQKWVVLHHLALSEQDGAVDASISFNKYIRQLSNQATAVFITTQVSARLVLLFNDLMSRGLAVEFFLVANKGDNVGIALERLRAMGVYTHIIEDWNFDELIKAGGSRATS